MELRYGNGTSRKKRSHCANSDYQYRGQLLNESSKTPPTRYILEGSEKLSYFTSRLGDEIAHMKGKRGGFAPHAERPDRIAHKLRSDLPVWVLCSVFALVCALGYIGLRTSLASGTKARMAAYNDVVKMAPRSANLTITLP